MGRPRVPESGSGRGLTWGASAVLCPSPPRPRAGPHLNPNFVISSREGVEGAEGRGPISVGTPDLCHLVSQAGSALTTPWEGGWTAGGHPSHLGLCAPASPTSPPGWSRPLWPQPARKSASSGPGGLGGDGSLKGLPRGCPLQDEGQCTQQEPREAPETTASSRPSPPPRPSHAGGSGGPSSPPQLAPHALLPRPGAPRATPDPRGGRGRSPCPQGGQWGPSDKLHTEVAQRPPRAFPTPTVLVIEADLCPVLGDQAARQ